MNILSCSSLVFLSCNLFIISTCVAGAEDRLTTDPYSIHFIQVEELIHSMPCEHQSDPTNKGLRRLLTH